MENLVPLYYLAHPCSTLLFGLLCSHQHLGEVLEPAEAPTQFD